MEFLKDVLGEELFTQVSDKLKDSKIKLADLSTGGYVGKEKFDTELKKVENLTAQLSEANKTIESFQSMDIDGIKKSAEDWKQKAAEAETKAAKEIESLQFNYAIDSALSGAKARNVKAVKSLLNFDGLKLTEGKVLGLDEQLAKIKEENDFLFESEQVKPQFAKPSEGAKPVDDSAVRAIMGLPNKK